MSESIPRISSSSDRGSPFIVPRGNLCVTKTVDTPAGNDIWDRYGKKAGVTRAKRKEVYVERSAIQDHMDLLASPWTAKTRLSFRLLVVPRIQCLPFYLCHSTSASAKSLNTYRHVGNCNKADQRSSVLRRDKIPRPRESVRRATIQPMCCAPAFQCVLHFERPNASFPLERIHSGPNDTLHSS